MTTLHIDLQIGFQNDAVEITIDGNPVFQETGVTTSLLEGIAEDFELEVEKNTHEVTVSLPDRGIASTTIIEVDREVYLGVSVEGGELVFQVSEEPFGYM